MNSWPRSMEVFGAYLLVTGLGFLLAPGLVLPAVGMPPPADFWPRVLGVVLVGASLYYVAAGRHRLRPIAAASVAVRYFVCAAFLALVLLAGAPRMLLAFGVLDAVFASWTWWGLRADAAR